MVGVVIQDVASAAFLRNVVEVYTDNGPFSTRDEVLEGAQKRDRAQAALSALVTKGGA